MTTTAAYTATMTELRGEPAHTSLWSSYGGSAHLPSRLSNVMEPYPSSSSASSHVGRPRTEHPEPPVYPYNRYSHDESDSYDRHPHGSLSSQHSYPLKRSFSQTEAPAYQEIVQDLRDDGSRLTVNHDHKLLAFNRAQDKHTVLDQHGRMQPLELSAQLHGMFFLSSEMPSNASDGSILQPELTCYRRNLFQISGSLITPRGQISIVNETGETVPVSNMEVTISAIESVDGNPVRLIVIPWKTPPPNSPEVNQGPDQEPPSLPLIPFQDEAAEAEGEYAVYPIGWRRLQFRIATANNGRRKELQQHFVLHLKVYGTLGNGNKVVLAESTTAPIVVRGRSPRNFQARKEIPLLGSSAGSRGQALVETGLGVIAGTLNAKQPETKVGGVDMQLPRTNFTFSPPKPAPPQLSSMRSNSYANWTAPSAASMAQIPTSGASYPATTIGTDSYPKVPLSGGPSFTAEPHELPLPSTMPPPVSLSLASNDHPQSPLRTPYPYVQSTTAPSAMSVSATTLGSSEPALNVPRYVDNPRPTKSPRHASHQSVHGNESVSNDNASEYRFGSYGSVNNNAGEVSQPSYNHESSSSNPAPTRDYYPPASSWTTAAGEHGSQVPYAGGDGRSYSFSHDQYKNGPPSAPSVKSESGQPAPPPVYNSGPRGSFDGMNNYSWSTS